MSHTDRRMTRAVDAAHTAALDSEFVPLPLAPIAPILRVANEIRRDNPRVAYLCYFHALKKISLIHLTSRELGVRQFKTQLQQRVEKEEVETKPLLAGNDAKEILLFYQTFYEMNIREGEDTKYPEEMAKVCQIATILYEVLKAVVPPDQIDLQIQRIADDVKKKRDQYPHYNILPLYAPGVKPAIMGLPEIEAAIRALRNVDYLPMPSKLAGDEESKPMMDRPTINDIFDWLSSIFGFQKGNMANQREHLILLLANINTRKNTNETRRNPEDYIRLSSSTVDRLEDKIFANYICWCKCLNCKPSTERFAGGYDKMQMKLVYIALFLLIWGEASNVRFMPECLCYIFHHMAKEIYVITYNNVHPVSGEAFESEVRDGEYFLRNIIMPLYDVLDKEAKRSRGGRKSNSKWRNYDDLNEFFWTDKCFSLGWPMNPKSKFFRHYTAQRSPANKRNQATADRSEPKTNFVELRTFWHLYRNFDRMWIFLALAFQAMVIVAWNSRTPSRPLSSLFDARVFTSVLSIVVTYAFLSLLRATLDIALVLNAWKSLKATQMVRHVLKFAVAAFWALVLAFEYRGFAKSKTGLTSFFDTNLSLYGLAVIVYLMPNLLDAILFVLPNLKRAMDNSKLWIIALLLWWTQEPQIYVGRDMCENWFSQLKYTLFWVTLLLSKLAFSYYVEVLPLVGPTREIMEMSVVDYQWHKLFPTVTQNTCVVVAIWAPIVLVYFMDVQLWYVIYSTLLGVIQGAFNHLGEVRTLEGLKSRSDTLPSAFTCNLIPRSTTNANENSEWESLEWRSIVIFHKVWNEFIKTMRMEDLLSNRDRDLLLAPLDSSGDFSVLQWPPYLLASKISVAIDLARSFRGTDDFELFKRIKFYDYMCAAVVEFYEGLRDVLFSLLNDESDKLIVKWIYMEIDESIRTSTFCNKFNMYGLLSLSERLEKLFKLLLYDEDEQDEGFQPRVINVLQDAMEIIIRDIMIYGHQILELDDHRYNALGYRKLQQRFENINHSVLHNESWKKKVARLYMLLTVRESAKIVPQNLEARRRITFFADSLFMNMPIAPRVHDMLSFSVLTPYYKEDVLYMDEELKKKNEDGISTLFYLQKIYTDEWMNFLERISDHTMYSYDERTELTRQWVSYRGQTLYRTVRGMMYYRQALELQCLLELVEHTALGSDSTPEKAVHNAAQALVDLKFTYVVSCQSYDALKKSDDPRDKNCYVNILKLMLTYPSLRVAYIHAALESVDGKYQKVYYSVLVKGGDLFEEEIYRIKLPGPPIDIGEAKAENQNHAIVFTRGEALQKIDTNQDNNFAEAFKLRNALEEFTSSRRKRKPTILGIRDHIFSGSVSSLSWFISNQENSSATIGQRILANPLRVRFHYGRNDIFDRIFHITRGGVSKASKVINRTMDDVFAGFNSTLRGGLVTHHEYIQMGRWRDVGMNQISLTDAMDASGNGEQTLSRDVHRLGRYFDFYRMLSFYYTTVGVYFSSMVAVMTVYVFLYGRLYVIMSGAEKEILKSATVRKNVALVETLATQFVIQMGLFLTLPMMIEIGLEKDFRTAFGDFIFMQLQLAPAFFTFRMGTKAHHYGNTLLYGSSKLRATVDESSFVVPHASFAENYRLYSRSHFVKGLELLVLVVVCQAYGDKSDNLFAVISDVSLWLLVASWLFAPFLFNPPRFDWGRTVDEWRDWVGWIENEGVIGIDPEKNWESWWEGEHEYLKYMSVRGKLLPVVLALRFFVYQYGIVYHLDITHRSKSLLVYGLSWVFTVSTLLVLKIAFTKRNPHRTFCNIYKAVMYFGVIAIMADLFVVYGLTITDLLAAILAFLPSAWAFVLIGPACRGLAKGIGIWESVKELAKAYDFVMGVVIFGPIAAFSWFPIVSKLQKRLLFYQAFIRGL